MDHRGFVLVLNTASVFWSRATAFRRHDAIAAMDLDVRSLDVKKNQGEVLARIHACSTKIMTTLVARVEEYLESFFRNARVETLAIDSGGQCKSLHALVVSPRIGKERFGGLGHQREPKCSGHKNGSGAAGSSISNHKFHKRSRRQIFEGSKEDSEQKEAKLAKAETFFWGSCLLNQERGMRAIGQTVAAVLQTRQKLHRSERDPNQPPVMGRNLRIGVRPRLRRESSRKRTPSLKAFANFASFCSESSLHPWLPSV